MQQNGDKMAIKNGNKMVKKDEKIAIKMAKKVEKMAIKWRQNCDNNGNKMAKKRWKKTRKR